MSNVVKLNNSSKYTKEQIDRLKHLYDEMLVDLKEVQDFGNEAARNMFCNRWIEIVNINPTLPSIGWKLMRKMKAFI
jgi:hypothetical protein